MTQALPVCLPEEPPLAGESLTSLVRRTGGSPWDTKAFTVYAGLITPADEVSLPPPRATCARSRHAGVGHTLGAGRRSN